MPYCLHSIHSIHICSRQHCNEATHTPAAARNFGLLPSEVSSCFVGRLPQAGFITSAQIILHSTAAVAPDSRHGSVRTPAQPNTARSPHQLPPLHLPQAHDRCVCICCVTSKSGWGWFCAGKPICCGAATGMPTQRNLVVCHTTTDANMPWGTLCLAGATVGRDDIVTMLEAANWAPTHGLTEPWRFVVLGRQGIEAMQDVTDRVFKSQLANQPELLQVIR